ncbi:MAG: hypothetical protein PF904_18200 [Kiritimatiellae bacterium]|nr:hypothetical protein [Kiritimatiellia bacterium]
MRMLCVFCVVTACFAAQAAIVVSGVNVATNVSSQAVAATYSSEVSNIDLIDSSQLALSSWEQDKDPFFASSELNDGTGMPLTGGTQGTYMPATFGSGNYLPFTYTYLLDTSSVTQGYDIVEIDSFAGWNENGATLGNQMYELLVSTVDTTNFISMGTNTYAPFDASSGSASATRMTLIDGNGGSITTGVDAIRFVFMDHGVHYGGVDGTVYTEVDVHGCPSELPSVAEPNVTVTAYHYDGSGVGAQPSNWADSGGVELINDKFPSDMHYSDGEWVGFLDELPDDGTSHPQVTFDLDARYVMSEIEIYYFHSITQAGGSVTAPEEVFVSFSTDGLNYTTPVSYTNEFDSSYAGAAMRMAALDVSNNVASYVRLDFRNTSPWTFLAEVDFTATERAKPPLALDDQFVGTSINVTNWIEHDSATKVSQNDNLLLADGTDSWSDCGLESTFTFGRNQECIIESVAKVSINTANASPIGYGSWDPTITSYFMAFRQNSNFAICKEDSFTDTGIAYNNNQWYKFRMTLSESVVLCEIYADLNGDGDFEDAGEGTDIIARAPGSYIAHSSYDDLKMRLNNYSVNLMTLKSVSIYENFTHESLNQAVIEAQALHDGAVEGSGDGAYPVGSKATLQSVIDAAEAVNDDQDATKVEIATAEADLEAAVLQFKASIIGGVSALNHIISTGQSLSVGWNGSPPLSTTQPYGNMMLSGLGQTGTELIPLIEGLNYTGANVETMSSSMANTLTVLSPNNRFTSVVARNGIGGAPYSSIKKGTSAYNKALTQVANAQAEAARLVRDYQVAAITTIHGESDHQNGNGEFYDDYLIEWQSDYNSDAKALTGQTNNIPMFLCQMSSHTMYNSTTSVVPSAQLWVSENSEWHTLVAPKYFLTYSDGVHLTAASYRHLGEYYGKAMKRVFVDKEEWIPLSPRKIFMNGSVITVDFIVPAGSIAIDTTLVMEQTNYGFEYADDSSSATISAVSVVDSDTISISLTATPTGSNPRLRYAYTGVAGSWSGWNQSGSARGNIRDSDATTSLYGNNLYNWLVHFDYTVPFRRTYYGTILIFR